MRSKESRKNLKLPRHQTEPEADAGDNKLNITCTGLNQQKSIPAKEANTIFLIPIVKEVISSGLFHLGKMVAEVYRTNQNSLCYQYKKYS